MSDVPRFRIVGIDPDFVKNFDPDQDRDEGGRWTDGGGSKPPHEMTRAEYNAQENKGKVDAIQSFLKSGNRIRLTTSSRLFPLSQPEHVRLTKSGDIQIATGKKWVYLTPDQVDSLTMQSGIPTVPIEERKYHGALVRDAFAAGKKIPDSVLKDYPDLLEPFKEE